MQLFLEIHYPDGTSHPLDIPIFSCVIAEQEAEVASARLVTDNQFLTHLADINGGARLRVGLISGDERTPLFCGTMSTTPVKHQDYFYTWELSAEPLHAQAMVQSLEISLQQHLPAAVTLLYDHISLAQLLENRCVVPLWHAASGKLGLSSLMTGSRHYDVSDDLIEDTLVLQQGPQPLSHIDVSVNVTWQQRCHGAFNIAPVIKEHYTQGIIHTLTPNVFMHQWPQIGHKWGHGRCYEVIKSRLTPIVNHQLAAQQALLSLHTITPVRTCLNQAGETQHICFRKSYFEAALWVMWHYQQPLSETVTFTVVDPTIRYQNSRALRFVINNPPMTLQGHENATTVLSTPTGQELLNYAYEVAYAHMIAQQRSLEVTLKLPLLRYRDIDLDTTLELRHITLPNGHVVGKVIAYALHIEADGQWLVVTIACAPQASLHRICAAPPQPQWQLQRLDSTVCQDPSQWTMRDFIESITIRGDSRTQEQLLNAVDQNETTPNPRTIACYMDALRQEGCGVDIQFRDLRAHQPLELKWENRVLNISI